MLENYTVECDKQETTNCPLCCIMLANGDNDICPRVINNYLLMACLLHFKDFKDIFHPHTSVYNP